MGTLRPCLRTSLCPAARYFAEQAALHKQARKAREFITAASAHAPTLLVELRDWRAVERWLRETLLRWRDLGSVEPKAWKTLDARLNAVLAPLRDALSAARDEAKTRRLALIEEVKTLTALALERDAPAKVKAVQAKWQTQAKELALAKPVERALWEQFRAACDAIFQAREAQRNQQLDVKREARGALENICVQLEQLALAPDKPEQHLRREVRDLEEQWTRRVRASDPALRALQSRFSNAKTAAEAALSARVRAREAAVWQTLAAKERLCEELDRLLCSRSSISDAAAVHAQWTALPALAAAWEKAMIGRRDAALRALGDEAAAAAHVLRIERGAELRREMLLELELLLGLECPPDLQAQRRALQLRKLRERFQGAAASGASTNGERLLAWCVQPGVADTRDRQRCDRVFSVIEHAR